MLSARHAIGRRVRRPPRTRRSERPGPACLRCNRSLHFKSLSDLNVKSSDRRQRQQAEELEGRGAAPTFHGALLSSRHGVTYAKSRRLEAPRWPPLALHPASLILCAETAIHAHSTPHTGPSCVAAGFSRGPPATHRVRNVQPLSMAQLLEVSRPSSLAVPAFFHALLLPACRILFLMPNFSPHTLCLRFTCQLLTHLQVRRCVQVVGARRVGHRRPSRPSYRAGQSNQLAGSASISSRSS